MARPLDPTKTRRAVLSGGGASGGATYVGLPTATANVRRPDGGMAVMTVELGLDAPDAALRSRVTQAMPRLRAACAEAVARQAGLTLFGTPPDVERLIGQLQAAVNQTLGRPGARVLIGTVMVL